MWGCSHTCPPAQSTALLARGATVPRVRCFPLHRTYALVAELPCCDGLPAFRAMCAGCRVDCAPRCVAGTLWPGFCMWRCLRAVCARCPVEDFIRTEAEPFCNCTQCFLSKGREVGLGYELLCRNHLKFCVSLPFFPSSAMEAGEM